MADYFNPGSGLPDQNQNPMISGGFAGGWNQGQTQQIMQPFRQNARDQQELALEEARAKFAEWSDPASVATRKSEIKTKGEEARARQKVLPSETKWKIAEHNSWFKQQPYEEQLNIQNYTNKYNEAKGKPQRDLMDTLADIAPELDKVPTQMKPAAWESAVRRAQEKHPGVKIDPKYYQYTPELESDIQRMFKARVHSYAEEQKLVAQREKDAADMEREKVKVSGQSAVAGIHEGGAMAREKLRVESDNRNTNPGQADERDKAILRNPNRLAAYAKVAGYSSVEEAKAAIEGNIAGRKEDRLYKIAADGAKARIANSIMPGSLDKGRTYGDILNEELATLTSKKPSGTDQHKQDAQAAIAKGADPKAVAQRYKQLTGKDL